MLPAQEVGQSTLQAEIRYGARKSESCGEVPHRTDEFVGSCKAKEGGRKGILNSRNSMGQGNEDDLSGLGGKQVVPEQERRPHLHGRTT